MKKILVVTTFNNHFRFFYRLSQTLQSLDFKSHFLTNKFSILKEGEVKNANMSLLTKSRKTGHAVNVNESFEVATGSLSKTRAEIISRFIWQKLELISKSEQYDYIFLWGGVRLIELTVSEFAKRNGIKTLFFELGNFPGKIFVDPKGTNARSLLAENSNILSSFSYDLETYNNWSDSYISESLKQHSVPQSKSAINIEYLKNIYDIYGFRFKKLIQTESILTKEKIIGKYLRKVLRLEYDNVNLSTSQYLFYPMQVNRDAQLILNSSVGNLEALEIANERAKKEGLIILVKPHPGEVEVGFIKKVNNLKEKLDFKFVNYNTIELIYNAQEVITINSTVGLQAKLAGKKVTCLGKAFYKDYNDKMLAAYMQSFLINAEFWNDVVISIESAEKILSRAELN